MFGCRDDQLYNGFITLCNTYAIKIHSTLISLVINILRQEKEANENEAIEYDRNGSCFTSSPRDLIKLFDEAFQVVRVKKIKELMLNMLHVYETITHQFQEGLQKFYDMKRERYLRMEFCIAQCNNYFLFWQVFQDLINPMLQSGMATDDEIQGNYNERTIIQKFNSMQEKILEHITNRIFHTQDEECTEGRALGTLFNQPFMRLSMQTLLTIILDAFEHLSDLMEEKTRRSAWSKFLDRTVFHYIQSLLTSSAKIKQQYPTEVIDKIKSDQEHIKDRFVLMMSQRACNLGLEVLDDLTSFFECSPEFISVPCEKLRRTQGQQFNNKVVKALMALRTDLERSERKQAIEICEEIIRNFKDNPNAGSGKNQGLFAIVEEMEEP